MCSGQEKSLQEKMLANTANAVNRTLAAIGLPACGPLSADKAAEVAFAKQPTVAELRADVADQIDELRLCLCAAKNGGALEPDEIDWLMIECGRIHNYFHAKVLR